MAAAPVSLMTRIGRRVFTLVKFGCILHCMTEYVGTFAVCHGISMQPTLHSGDIILGDRLAITRRKLENGEIVLCKSPEDPFMYVCKRVVAMEGERVFNKGWYTKIPKGHVWLEGDNRDFSHDSRSFGPVPYALVYTKVFYRIWPPNQVGSLSDKSRHI
ncbi:mitochondrial inner membrane protease subunit 1-like [Mizuhopecten yessoensis]|uniref:mitochondrial inner membrane protease subunit 1-like n=1 Tax=Mizuhopecten yessoensis TaxID=6573 RepID=UPI000B45915B|nr:mitochondrial inner membrane protease subunit 1-like [Mizuhopecten yessoensis]